MQIDVNIILVFVCSDLFDFFKHYYLFIFIYFNSSEKKKQNNKTSIDRPGKDKSPKTVNKKDVPSQT